MGYHSLLCLASSLLISNSLGVSSNLSGNSFNNPAWNNSILYLDTVFLLIPNLFAIPMLVRGIVLFSAISNSLI